LNAASEWQRLAQALGAQGIAPEQVLVVDSQSTDGTAQVAKSFGFGVEQIERSRFNHGATRQWALQFFPDSAIVVFLTQDAIPANPDALRTLVRALDDPTVAAAFGRQLPRPAAGPIEAYARLFNYPEVSGIRGFESRDTLGIKTIFISNSFAAYRRRALDEVGGFPSHVIFGEDTVTAARLLQKGWRIAYVAEAQVYHSHDYSSAEEFKRYFDIGVLHARESWLLENFGRTADEGAKFVRSEVAYLCKRCPWLVPVGLWRNALKFVGYQLGRMERRLSSHLKRRLSMHKEFWVTDQPRQDSRHTSDMSGHRVL